MNSFSSRRTSMRRERVIRARMLMLVLTDFHRNSVGLGGSFYVESRRFAVDDGRRTTSHTLDGSSTGWYHFL